MLNDGIKLTCYFCNPTQMNTNDSLVESYSNATVQFIKLFNETQLSPFIKFIETLLQTPFICDNDYHSSRLNALRNALQTVKEIIPKFVQNSEQLYQLNLHSEHSKHLNQLIKIFMNLDNSVNVSLSFMVAFVSKIYELSSKSISSEDQINNVKSIPGIKPTNSSKFLKIFNICVVSELTMLTSYINDLISILNASDEINRRIIRVNSIFEKSINNHVETLWNDLETLDFEDGSSYDGIYFNPKLTDSIDFAEQILQIKLVFIQAIRNKQQLCKEIDNLDAKASERINSLTELYQNALEFRETQ